MDGYRLQFVLRDGAKRFESLTLRVGRLSVWIGRDALLVPRYTPLTHVRGGQITWLWFAFNILPECNGRNCPCASYSKARVFRQRTRTARA